VPEEDITVSVSDGWVTLKGRVKREHQRAAATNAVRDLPGVRGVTNTIAIDSHISALDIKSTIEAALTRKAEIDARRISVAVRDRRRLNADTKAAIDEARMESFRASDPPLWTLGVISQAPAQPATKVEIQAA
jgi:hypothetical protein